MTAKQINTALPFALHVANLTQNGSIHSEAHCARNSVNPLCLHGFTANADTDLRANCLRQLRLESGSSVLLRQLAKILQTPTLIVDPLHIQGGWLSDDPALHDHPHMDLQAAGCIDFILTDSADYHGLSLSAGDALLRRADASYGVLQPHGEYYRVVYYQAVPAEKRL